MKKRIIPILLIFFIFNLFGQKGNFEPFKLAVEKPNFAKIEEGLKHQIGTIEETYVEQYSSMIKQLEELVQFDGYSDEMKSQYEEMKQETLTQLESLKSREQEVKDFKYYEFMSYYLTSVLNFYFNEYEPFSEIYEIPNFHNDGTDYKVIADSLKADYVISFEDIKSLESNGLYQMESRLILYSTVENKIIVEEKIYGDTNSYGDMWTCSEELTCLFITSVRNSIQIISKTLVEKQGRK